MKAALPFVALLLLTAPPALAQAPPAGEPMALYGVSVGPQGVTFRAPMSACHDRIDFTLAVLKRAPEAVVLLSPRRAGMCAPAGAGHVEVTYGFEDLGLKPDEPFTLGNPLIAEPPRP